MRTSIRPDELARLGRITEEDYDCGEWGVGHLLLAGGQPIALELPGPVQDMKARRRGCSAWAQDLERYFRGERVQFAFDVDTFAEVHGLTDFERDVYAALSRVPYGTAVSYRDLATDAGRPNAYRAVGSIMARNPLPVILPCHRVIKNDGRLGFYGDDPAWKVRLLTLEGVAVADGKVIS